MSPKVEKKYTTIFVICANKTQTHASSDNLSNYTVFFVAG